MLYSSAYHVWHDYICILQVVYSRAEICTIIKKLQEEPVLLESEHGPLVSKLLGSLSTPECMEADKTRDFFSYAAKQLDICLQAGERCKLPSSKAQRMWSAFHKFRNKPELLVAWSACIQNQGISDVDPSTTRLGLQVLIDRWFKSMILNRSKKPEQAVDLTPLSAREQNVVFYMSGYVAVKLLTRFRKKSDSKAVEEKNRIFVKILSKMQANQQVQDIKSIDDYTREWSEQIDRGGLYHIKSEVYFCIHNLCHYTLCGTHTTWHN